MNSSQLIRTVKRLVNLRRQTQPTEFIASIRSRFVLYFSRRPGGATQNGMTICPGHPASPPVWRRVRFVNPVRALASVRFVNSAATPAILSSHSIHYSASFCKIGMDRRPKDPVRIGSFCKSVPPHPAPHLIPGQPAENGHARRNRQSFRLPGHAWPFTCSRHPPPRQWGLLSSQPL